MSPIRIRKNAVMQHSDEQPAAACKPQSGYDIVTPRCPKAGVALHYFIPRYREGLGTTGSCASLCSCLQIFSIPTLLTIIQLMILTVVLLVSFLFYKHIQHSRCGLSVSTCNLFLFVWNFFLWEICVDIHFIMYIFELFSFQCIKE